MTVMLQVRNLPDDVHARLKERATAARMTLSDYVAMELGKLVEYRTNSEILAEFHARHPELRTTRIDGAALVREGRAERDAELDRRLDERVEPSR